MLSVSLCSILSTDLTFQHGDTSDKEDIFIKKKCMILNKCYLHIIISENTLHMSTFNILNWNNYYFSHQEVQKSN